MRRKLDLTEEELWKLIEIYGRALKRRKSTTGKDEIEKMKDNLLLLKLSERLLDVIKINKKKIEPFYTKA